jgi:hypothetical protein
MMDALLEQAIAAKALLRAGAGRRKRNVDRKYGPWSLATTVSL